MGAIKLKDNLEVQEGTGAHALHCDALSSWAGVGKQSRCTCDGYPNNYLVLGGPPYLSRLGAICQ